jgi:3alpha(or 20beta)-hydroxysteroid dehydrogenase
MGRLDGKVALVSGGARGIGAAIIARFLNEGAKAIVSDVLDAEGEQLVAQLGDGVRFVHLDVTKPADWDKAVSEAMSAFASLSALVNNAGYCELRADR